MGTGDGVPPRYYRIGDVIRASGISRQTLHNYTHMGLVRERERTPSGHRLYGEEVFQRLERIRDLKAQGMSLRQIREILEREEMSHE